MEVRPRAEAVIGAPTGEGSRRGLTAAQVLLDHLQRAATALRGFRFLGPAWLPVWLVYAVSPLIRLSGWNENLRFGDFSVRVRATDLYCFANVFYDYDARQLLGMLDRIDKVVDAGANVGAFSYLVNELAVRRKRRLEMTAIEPEPSNFDFLRQQRFARDMECLRAALGPHSGTGRLLPGGNEATHRVVVEEAIPQAGGVRMVTLNEVCRGRTLLKMDIEGGEWEVLEAGLPEEVVAMFLECHSGGKHSDPRQLVNTGTWRLLSRDLYGSSTWSWVR